MVKLLEVQGFDPLERERPRQAVQQYGGDRVLLELDDEALDGALGLTARQPDGSRTDAHNVVLRLPTVPADLEFRRLVVDEERRRNAELPIDSLIALGALRELKRLTVEELAERIQRDVASAKRTYRMHKSPPAPRAITQPRRISAKAFNPLCIVMGPGGRSLA